MRYKKRERGRKKVGRDEENKKGWRNKERGIAGERII